MNGRRFGGWSLAQPTARAIKSAAKPANVIVSSRSIINMASRKDHKILLEEWEMPTKWYVEKGLVGEFSRSVHEFHAVTSGN
jgi:hypothetical protein